MRFIAGIVKAVSIVVTSFVILVAGALFIPRLFGFVPYVVQSGSMEPAIKTGAIAYVNTKAKEPAAGEIIAYSTSDGTVVLHRAVSYNQEEATYTTKGDANSTQDAVPVSSNAVVGTFALQVPGGYAIAKFESHTIHIGRIKLPAMSLIIIGLVVVLNTIDAALDSKMADLQESSETAGSD